MLAWVRFVELACVAMALAIAPGCGEPAAHLQQAMTSADAARSATGRGGVANSADAADAASSECIRSSMAASPLRRLTRIEYENTVRDLLGVADAAAGFPSDEMSSGFANDARSLSVTALLAEKYMASAEALAADAVRDLPALLACDRSAVGDDACVLQFLQRFGRRAYRRPLTDDELGRLANLFATARAEADFSWGMEVVLQAMLQSPQFLYRFESGIPAGPDVPAVRLTQYELATRLSYLVWATMPDERLSRAADAGRLASAAQVGEMVREMLNDPRAQPAIGEFYRQWLDLSTLSTLYKDAQAYPAFTSELRAELVAEVPAFVQHVLWNDDARLQTLLMAPWVSGRGPLAALYGVSAPVASDSPIVMADPAQRAGILTLASVLAAYGLPDQSSPVHRGKLIRERLLCQDLAPPPPGLMVTAPEIDASRPTRERFEEHRESAQCAVCHELMDPIGLGFEAYDGIGRHRETDAGKPIDDSGTIVGAGSLDGDFRGARELVTKLAGSEQVRSCVALQWFRYAFGRTDEPADRCALATIDQAFSRSDGDLRELVVALTQSESFLYRNAVEASSP